MTEYLMNVAMKLAPVLAVIIILYILLRYAIYFFGKIKFLNKAEIKYIKKYLNAALVVVTIIALGLALTSPSITYKNQTFDRENKSVTIQRSTEEPKGDIIVIDRTKQPSLNEEERSKRFDDLTDYKSRSQ